MKFNNYFQIFSLPIAFKINNNLEEIYYSLQQQYHPDFNNKLDDNNNQNYLTIINEAYKILNDPLLRAIYILQLKFKINLNEDNSGIKPDITIISEILEIEEKIEERKAKKENIKDIIDNIKLDLNKRLELAISQIENKIEINLENIELASQNLIKCKYLQKIINDNKNY
jgi:molecular chaperone HscB